MNPGIILKKTYLPFYSYIAVLLFPLSLSAESVSLEKVKGWNIFTKTADHESGNIRKTVTTTIEFFYEFGELRVKGGKKKKSGNHKKRRKFRYVPGRRGFVKTFRDVTFKQEYFDVNDQLIGSRFVGEFNDMVAFMQWAPAGTILVLSSNQRSAKRCGLKLSKTAQVIPLSGAPPYYKVFLKKSR